MAKKTSKEKPIESRICIKLKNGKEVRFGGLEVESVELVQDASPIDFTVIDRKELYNRIFTHILHGAIEFNKEFGMDEKSKSEFMLMAGTVLYFNHIQHECNCTRLDLLHFCEEYKLKCGKTCWGEGLLLDKAFLERAIKILEENAKSI